MHVLSELSAIHTQQQLFWPLCLIQSPFGKFQRRSCCRDVIDVGRNSTLIGRCGTKSHDVAQKVQPQAMRWWPHRMIRIACVTRFALPEVTSRVITINLYINFVCILVAFIAFVIFGLNTPYDWHTETIIKKKEKKKQNPKTNNKEIKKWGGYTLKLFWTVWTDWKI